MEGLSVSHVPANNLETRRIDDSRGCKAHDKYATCCSPWAGPFFGRLRTPRTHSRLHSPPISISPPFTPSSTQPARTASFLSISVLRFVVCFALRAIVSAFTCNLRLIFERAASPAASLLCAISACIGTSASSRNPHDWPQHSLFHPIGAALDPSSSSCRV